MNLKRKTKTLLFATATGAALSYLLDPVQGRHRRQRLLRTVRERKTAVVDLVDTAVEVKREVVAESTPTEADTAPGSARVPDDTAPGIAGVTDTEGTRPEPAFARGAETLLDALADARAHGFPHELVAKADGTLVCGNCDERFAAREFAIAHETRLEGASDAADLMLVMAGRCVRCGEGGALVVGYGPNASDADVAVLSAFDDTSGQNVVAPVA